MKNGILGVVQVAVFALLLLEGCARSNQENRYKIGTARVSVVLEDGEEPWPDSVLVCAVYPTLFSLEQSNLTTVFLQHDDGKWSADVPVEALRLKMGGVSVFYPDSTFITGVMCGYDQDKPTDIKIKRGSNNRYFYSVNDGEYSEVHYEDGMVYGNFISANMLVAPESYETWQKYIRAELDTVLPNRIESAFENTKYDAVLKHFITEQFKQFYFKGRITWYVSDAERFCDLDVNEPPAEMYKMYLDSLDLSAEMVVDETIPEMFYFYQRFLDRLPIDIPEIGEMDIAEWQAAAMPELKKVLSNPTQVFVDKLSAVAFITQIEEGNLLLTEKQKANIMSYYRDDLGKIILNHNERIAAALKNAESELINLADDECFSLPDFIKRFEGRPVVVDLWNTWCGPCIEAMGNFKEVKEQRFADSDVVFLYICNTSSPEQKWRSYAERESGVHVRLAEETYYEIMSGHELYGVPSYMFFDRSHKLVEKYTGFPGVDGFVGSISKIED